MLFLRILPVFAILFVGFGAGAVSLFSSTRTAIQVLNRYSLYIAAPLLIFAGMVDPSLSLPLRPGFYLAHVLALMVGLLFVLLCMPVRTLRPHAGRWHFPSRLETLPSLAFRSCCVPLAKEL